MMILSRAAVALALLTLLPVGAAYGGLVSTLDDIDYWVGSGTNRSAVVIDWNDGRDSLAWGYRWDGAATGEDMLLSILDADLRLTADFSDFGTPAAPNLFARAVGYDRNRNGFSSSDPQDSFAVSGDFVSDFRYWEYFNATDSPYSLADGAGVWRSANTGISGRSLTDGAWDGFSFDDVPGGGSPNQPFAAAAVPEPGTWLLALLAGGGLAVRRRGLGGESKDV